MTNVSTVVDVVTGKSQRTVGRQTAKKEEADLHVDTQDDQDQEVGQVTEDDVDTIGHDQGAIAETEDVVTIEATVETEATVKNEGKKGTAKDARVGIAVGAEVVVEVQVEVKVETEEAKVEAVTGRSNY